MSKPKDFWLFETEDRILATKIDPRILPLNDDCVIIAHVIEMSAYDELKAKAQEDLEIMQNQALELGKFKAQLAVARDALEKMPLTGIYGQYRSKALKQITIESHAVVEVGVLDPDENKIPDRYEAATNWSTQIKGTLIVWPKEGQ